jgi:hypothetical protein
MNKNDMSILKRGLRRTVLALVTEIVFALTVFDLVLTARAPGYLAVLLFLASILLAVATVVLLYAQGLQDGVHIESVVDGE